MTPELLASIGASLLSLVFKYVPGARRWFATLDGTYKRLVMLGMLLITSGGIYILACSDLAAPLGIPVACDANGAAGILKTLVWALMSNQATFMISPDPDDNATNA